MTTIAYRRGVVACDRQGTDGGLKSRCSFKATVRGDSMYFISGTLYRGLKFIEWVEDGGPEQEDVKAPDLKSTEVLQLHMKTGKLTIWEADYPMPCEDPFYAWGSGAHLAIGAMAQGADPRKAVEIASKWDESTGLGVQYFESKPARQRRERKP